MKTSDMVSKWARVAPVVLAVFPILSGPIAQAVPVKNPECAKKIQIRSAENGSGTVFNEDCSIAYVLPPKTGTLSISGYRPSANLDYQCGRLRQLEEEQSRFGELTLSQTNRLLQYEKDIQIAESNLRQGLIPVGKSVEEMQAQIDGLILKMGALRAQIHTYQQQNDEQKLGISKIAGGNGVFILNDAFSDLVEAYRKANPKIRFEPINVDLGFLSVNEIKADDATASQMPAVLSLQVNGEDKMPLLMDASILLAHPEFAPQTTGSGSGSKIFGGALGGSIQMSNMGACALRESMGARERFTITDLQAYISATATYNYQLQVTRRHSITYDLHELVRQIHEQTRKSGFFNRSTLDSFVDERRSTSWITFNVESQDQRFQYTDDYVRDVKKEFISRALAQVVSIQTGSPAAVLALIDPTGKNGSDVAGEELGKCPHLYCQIGAAGFRALSSIFGSETAATHLLKTFDGSASESVTEKRMISAYGTSAFK